MPNPSSSSSSSSKSPRPGRQRNTFIIVDESASSSLFHNSLAKFDDDDAKQEDDSSIAPQSPISSSSSTRRRQQRDKKKQKERMVQMVVQEIRQALLEQGYELSQEFDDPQVWKNLLEGNENIQKKIGKAAEKVMLVGGEKEDGETSSRHLPAWGEDPQQDGPHSRIPTNSDHTDCAIVNDTEQSPRYGRRRLSMTLDEKLLLQTDGVLTSPTGSVVLTSSTEKKTNKPPKTNKKSLENSTSNLSEGSGSKSSGRRSTSSGKSSRRRATREDINRRRKKLGLDEEDPNLLFPGAEEYLLELSSPQQQRRSSQGSGRSRRSQQQGPDSPFHNSWNSMSSPGGAPRRLPLVTAGDEEEGSLMISPRAQRRCSQGSSWSRRSIEDDSFSFQQPQHGSHRRSSLLTTTTSESETDTSTGRNDHNAVDAVGEVVVVNTDALPTTTMRTEGEQEDKKTLCFSSIRIRCYERILSDNPSCKEGPPIGIGWRYSCDKSMSVDEWENFQGERRLPSELLLSRQHREEMLRQAGYSARDLAEAVRKLRAAQSQRKRTVENTNTGAEKVEAVVESAMRKVKRAMGLRLTLKQ